MGSPVSRVGDITTPCPLQCAPGCVHGPETLAIGAPTVLVQGSLASRVGDIAVGCGPPAPVSVGSATVFISGAPCARVGSMTAHGSTLILGASTVFVA
jgi:uncharacterized Zn-binding protein involved in type VI secretion